jgi:hypothetical protein
MDHVRNIVMIPFNTMTRGMHIIDNYSGMWWVRLDMFQQKCNGNSTNLEGVSFILFKNIGHWNIYMTRDWLDFIVVYISRYFNVQSMHVLSNFQSVDGKYTTYMEKASRIILLTTERSAFRSTLAIVPMSTHILLHDVDSKDRVPCRYMYALSATLTSLWQSWHPTCPYTNDFCGSTPLVSMKQFRVIATMELIETNHLWKSCM